MITTVVTFLTTRIMYVFIVVVVAVGAVPTLIVAIQHGNTLTVTSAVASSSRHNDDLERERVMVEVKAAGDDVVVKISNEEAGCDSQISQLATLSRLPAAATRAALERGKGQFHAATTRFVDELKADEDELEHLGAITTQTEQTILVRISTLEVTALGGDGHPGMLITLCQTVLVEIRRVIIVVTPQPAAGEGDDLRV